MKRRSHFVELKLIDFTRTQTNLGVVADGQSETIQKL